MPRMRLPVSRPISMLLGLALATSPVAPSVAQASLLQEAPGDESGQAKQLNADAQSKFASGDLPGAANTYGRILEILTENRVNREERDNTLLVALEVYREAFRQADAGGEELTSSIELLRTGVRLYDAYEAEYQRVYGGGADPSLEARESGDEIKKMLAEAEAKLGPPEPPPKPKVDPPKKQPVLTPITVPIGPSGVGLIVAGSITMAAGLGTIAMIIVGSKQTRDANNEREDAMTQAEADEADRKGRRGDALIISGSVLTGVLLAGGATMLGIGISRRRRYMAFSPQIGPRYVGAGFRARF